MGTNPTTTGVATHIRRDQSAVAWIDDTNTKVSEVILDWLAHGWSPAEIHFQHPHLSLAQVHAAFAHYYDHPTEIENDIARREELVKRLRAESPEPPVVARILASRAV